MNDKILYDEPFAFTGPWPEEVLSAIRPLMSEYSHLVPRWCLEVTVLWDPIETKIANCRIDFLHRMATIRFGAAFLSSDEGERRMTVVHELLHVSTMPLTCDTEDLICEQVEDGLFRKLLLARIEEREEFIVADLSRAICGQGQRD